MMFPTFRMLLRRLELSRGAKAMPSPTLLFDSFNQPLDYHNPFEGESGVKVNERRLNYLLRPKGCVINDREMCL